MRAHNERLVLSLVRSNGALSKTEIARLTGLSMQTVSVIMRQLEADRLLRRGEPQRGRVGQPMVPLSLDPEGAFFIGAKIGRRSLDFLLVDFVGGVRYRAGAAYPFPTPEATVQRIVAEVAACEALLGERAGRIAGLGLAMPFELWNWAEAVGAPPGGLEAWRRTDIRPALAERLPYPVYIQNDATAACGAELAFGDHAGLLDFIYFYIGAFVGGGLVLSGGLFAGRTGNAAALGSMPVPDGSGGSAQLIDQVSTTRRW
jgi:predicted NBD/HSP70 family sugar kinase